MATVDQSVSAPPTVSRNAYSSPETLPSPSTPQPGKSKQLLATFMTTVAVFGIYFLQGILIARILGPIGRGEFGTAIFFPRDILLYVGLLGGVEIVTKYATDRRLNATDLKNSAATLGLFSGTLTAFVSALVATITLLIVNNGAKAYLIPYCWLVCLFVPWEHLQLTIAGVDRGRERFARYNFNRLVFAASFPLLVLLYWLAFGRAQGANMLTVICVLFVLSRVFGVLPTFRGLRFRDWFSSCTSSGQNADPHYPQPTTWQLLRKGGPYGLSMLASEIFERLDVLLILALASIQESGFYFVAVPAAALLTIAPNSLAVFTFNAGADKRPVTLRFALLVIVSIVVVQVISLFVLWHLVPLLIVTFYGQAFEPSIQYVWYLLPAFAIKGFLQAMDGYLKGSGLPMIGVWARCLSILGMLWLVYVLFSKHELLSIPMASCAGQTLSMLIVTFFVLKRVVALDAFANGGADDLR